MKTRIKLLLTISLTLILLLPALAASPHFIGSPKLTLSGGNVQVCWKEAGLGANQNIDYTLTADATATFNCVNGGGNCPNAANKTTVSGPVSATGTFASGKNGSISACLTLEPPDAGGFTCPGGQHLTLSQVGFSNIHLTDTTNNVAAPVGSASVTLFTCP